MDSAVRGKTKNLHLLLVPGQCHCCSHDHTLPLPRVSTATTLEMPPHLPGMPAPRYFYSGHVKTLGGTRGSPVTSSSPAPCFFRPDWQGGVKGELRQSTGEEGSWRTLPDDTGWPFPFCFHTTRGEHRGTDPSQLSCSSLTKADALLGDPEERQDPEFLSPLTKWPNECHLTSSPVRLLTSVCKYEPLDEGFPTCTSERGTFSILIVSPFQSICSMPYSLLEFIQKVLIKYLLNLIGTYRSKSGHCRCTVTKVRVIEITYQ